ncbi:uncharacterized protein LOC104890857 isoform X2 [Beta vulgaris subsp. vulgaris]|nr:uncharacterized protein LOC104890857 isoform X2 [Beta vulgaris subsp. vulgaris]
MYGYDGYTFQKHFIDQNNGNSHFFSKDHRYRLQCYYTEPQSDPSTNLFKVEHYWKSHKYLQRSSWLEKWLRRELQALIQEEDVEIIMHHIVGVVESFSRSYHRKGKSGSPKLKREEFKSLVTTAAMPFLTARTKRFVDEMELFLASGLTVEAYDGAYRRWLAWKKPEETSEDNEETSREREARASYLYVFDDETDEVD